MTPYIVSFYSQNREFLFDKFFYSQAKLKKYLKGINASYDAHKLSVLGDDSLVVSKLDFDGYIEIQELALPPKTETVVIDGIEYISVEEAVRRLGVPEYKVRSKIKTDSLNTIRAGAMSRVFVENVF